MRCVQILIIAVASTIGASPASGLTDPAAVTLKIATYNINWGNPDLTAVVSTIRQSDADVVCLQETTKQSESHIRRTLRKDYSHIHFHGHRGRFGAERFGFLSRHRMRGLSFLPPKHGLFGAYVGRLQLGGQTIQIVNVHLQPIVLPSAGMRSAYSAFTAMEDIHRKEITHIYENVRLDVPTLIVGDFNSTSSFRATRFLTRNGFVDSFAQIHADADAHPTWHWPLKHGEWALRIDYIFHSRHFTTTESTVMPSEGSDHYLVSASLSLKQGERAELGLCPTD
jgi:endonuclease/exonuclease/phosphatase family metal-dependent hydrolase